MYLLIHEDGEPESVPAYTNEDVECVAAGMISIVRFFEGKFQTLTVEDEDLVSPVWTDV